MSINDPVKLYYNNRRGKWILMQGRETFYDENNTLVEFDTVEQALEWAGEEGHQVSEDSFPGPGSEGNS